MEYYLVGKIVGTHGIKGELKVINDSDFDRFFVGNTLYVKRDNRYEKITINSVRNHKNMLLITINNKTDINDVLSFVNTEIYVHGHEKLENGKYYMDDLIGLDVYDTDNNKIGVVNDMVELPKDNLLEIKKLNGKLSLVPYVDEFVKEIDLDNKKMVIKVIEGLL